MISNIYNGNFMMILVSLTAQTNFSLKTYRVESFEGRLSSGVGSHTAEEIRCVFDDISKIIFVKSS